MLEKIVVAYSIISSRGYNTFAWAIVHRLVEDGRHPYENSQR